MDPVLQQLRDENDIRDLVIRFSNGMDSNDYDLFRSAWADEVELEIPPRGDAVPLTGTFSGDDYARGVIALLSEFEHKQHVSSNHLVTVTGNSATCIAYVHGTHYLAVPEGESWWTVGARYDLAARRFESGWRLTRFKLTELWSIGNKALWDEASRRLEAR